MRLRPLTVIALVLCLDVSSLRAEPAAPESQPHSSQPDKDSKGDANHNEPFVDRDGDGIQDGKEHRFRKRQRRGRRGEGDGEQRRIRRREGPGAEGRGRDGKGQGGK